MLFSISTSLRTVLLVSFLLLLFVFCDNKNSIEPGLTTEPEENTEPEETTNPEGTIKPDVITEKTKHDTDDPAIWVNRADPSRSIIFGTDKNSDGALYAFDLEGKIIEGKTISDLGYPNNVDLRYDFQLRNQKADILVLTERDREQIRIYSIPDMTPLDNGGFAVFEDEDNSDYRAPMGISLYHSPIDGALYAIVGRKNGPKEGYLYQYRIEAAVSGVSLKLVRKFGKFSGKKEIEAIAVDDELGFVYYSDETHCIRKYYAEPSMGDEELACFGGDRFERDIEGIAIVAYPDAEGYIIVSNQQNGSFSVFSRKDNTFNQELDLDTNETDGCEVTTASLDGFTDGIFVAMNNDKNFFYYSLSKLGL